MTWTVRVAEAHSGYRGKSQMNAATWSGGAVMTIDWVDVSAIAEDYRPASGRGLDTLGQPVHGQVRPGGRCRGVRAQKRDDVGDLFGPHPPVVVGAWCIGPVGRGVD